MSAEEKMEMFNAIEHFGRKDLLMSPFSIQDTDTNIEVFLSTKDMVKYYKQGNEIERLNNIINQIKELVDNYEKLEQILGAGKPQFQLYKLQAILKGEE